MNPLDKSWDFLKAKRIDPKNIEFTERAKKNRATKRRLAEANKPDDAQTKLYNDFFNDPRFQMSRADPDLSMTPESREEAVERLRAEILARNRKAREKLEEEAEGPKYPNPPMSEPSQSALVSSTGIYDPHDPRTMQPRRGA